MSPTSTAVTAVQCATAPATASVGQSPTVAPETGTCATCLRAWDLADLFDDRDGDPMCVDCWRSDTSAEDAAAYRSYVMGR